MEDIYKSWVDFGVDGFRIDTVKHVNMQFWQSFSPAILDHAKATGKNNFFMFGEVYDGNPAYTSQFTTKGKLPATLDFGFQGAALGFAQGKATTGIRDLFAGDDYYTDTDSNAYELPTFLGNHDMGRVGAMLLAGGATGDDLLARDRLATSLMFLTRGQPVVYYGDEQGFTGPTSDFGDKRARQDMFATKTPIYQDDVVVGSSKPAGTAAHYDTSAPLYREIKALSALRAANPALADGAQVHRYASDAAGIYAVSRIDKAAKREYVVVANNATTAKTATFSTYSAGSKFVPLLGATADLRGGSGRPRDRDRPAAVGGGLPRERGPWHSRSRPRPIYPTSPSAGGVVGGRAEIGAALPGNTFAEVTFLQRPVGTSAWTPIGTDDNAPYRVFHDVSGLPRGRWSSTAWSPRTSPATSRRRPPTASSASRRPPGAAGAAASARSPSPTTSASRAATTPRWAAPATGSRTAPRRSWPSTPRTTSGRARSTDPCRRLRVQGRDQQVVGRELRRGRRHGRRQHRLHRARRQAGHVLLRPPHALGHERRPGPDHHGARQLPERARLPRRLGAGLHAVVAAGPRR